MDDFLYKREVDYGIYAWKVDTVADSDFMALRRTNTTSAEVWRKVLGTWRATGQLVFLEGQYSDGEMIYFTRRAA